MMDDKYFVNYFIKPIIIHNIITNENHHNIDNIMNILFTNELNNGIKTYIVSIENNIQYNERYLNHLILSIYTNKINDCLLINKNIKKNEIKKNLINLLKSYNINETNFSILFKNNKIFILLKNNDKNKINHNKFCWNNKFIFITNNIQETNNKSIKINNYYLHNKYEEYLEKYKYNDTNLLEIIKMI